MRAMAIGIILLLFSAFQLFLGEYRISVIFVIVSMPFFLIQRFAQIDTNKKTFINYLSVLGIPFGKKHLLNDLKGIKILKSKSSQVVNSRVQTSQLSTTEYHAYIYFDGDKKLLGISDEKKPLVEEMSKIAEELKIPLKD